MSASKKGLGSLGDEIVVRKLDWIHQLCNIACDLSEGKNPFNAPRLIDYTRLVGNYKVEVVTYAMQSTGYSAQVKFADQKVDFFAYKKKDVDDRVIQVRALYPVKIPFKERTDYVGACGPSWKKFSDMHLTCKSHGPDNEKSFYYEIELWGFEKVRTPSYGKKQLAHNHAAMLVLRYWLTGDMSSWEEDDDFYLGLRTDVKVPVKPTVPANNNDVVTQKENPPDPVAYGRAALLAVFLKNGGYLDSLSVYWIKLETIPIKAREELTGSCDLESFFTKIGEIIDRNPDPVCKACKYGGSIYDHLVVP